ncbi:hypothetical protein [Sphingomonas sp. dw_22]|uniref:hypothetical protein n=1 Tax=Sphingomonas sp. dw_22 TaxID=2721175 RepID=UPI001BD59C3B|nr:hypothetical protein [Sphingomonas sp. dw_22]
MRLLPLIALLTFAAPALAQQQAPTQAAEQPKDDKQVCRRIPVTGSNFGKRECHTKAEWAQIHAADQENAARALDNRRAAGGNSGL